MFINDKTLLCKKGKIYESYPPTDFELESGLYIWVKNELPGSGTQILGTPVDCSPLTLKTFEKYFSTIDEMRDIKINEILK